MTGGSNGSGSTVYDSGTAQITIGSLAPAHYAWTHADTSATVASGLAAAVNATDGATVHATASGAAITLQAVAAGFAGNMSVAMSSAYNTATFNVSSVTFSGASAMAGGVNGVTAVPSAVAYQYSPIVWADNGNLISATDSVLGTQSFTYDTLNRVKQASFNGSKGNFTLAWSYDAFGNRISQVPGGTSTLTFYQAAASTYNGTSLQNGTQLSGAYNNRIDGQNYDASGNMLGTATEQFTYDAASRIVTAGSVCYLYDAAGHRTAKGVWSGTACGNFTAQYILGLGGEQLTELDGAGNWKHTNVYDGSHLVATYDAIGTHFHLNDWLGTERAQVSANGVVDEVCVDLPFGDSQTCSGPGVDATEHHFTGKIRDVESGLDYFEARYYNSNLGRWMTPDWSAKPEEVPYASLDSPQSLNLYNYVENNSLSKADADGHVVIADDVIIAAAVATIATAAVIAAYENTPAGQRSI